MARFDYNDAGEWQGMGKVILYKGCFRLRMEPMANVDKGTRTTAVEYYIPANLTCATHRCYACDSGGRTTHHSLGCHNARGARLCDETCRPRFDALYGRRGDEWEATEPMSPVLNDVRAFRIYRKSERASVAWFLDRQTQTQTPTASTPDPTASAPDPSVGSDPGPAANAWIDPTPSVTVPTADPTTDPDPVPPSSAQVAQAVATLGTVERVLRMFTARQHDGAPVNVNLVGPAGCGKTTMVRMIAERMGLTLRTLKFTTRTAPYEVMGRRDDVQPDGTFAFRGTAFTETYLNGGLLFLDEFDCADPNTATTLHEPLANGHCTIDGVEYARRDDFFCIAACNTYGSGSRVYVGREKLDEATLSRFVPLSVDYDLDYEQGILDGCHNDDVKINLINFRNAIRHAINTGELRRTFSTRHLVQWVALINVGETLRDLAHEYFLAWSSNDRDTAREYGAFAHIS